VDVVWQNGVTGLVIKWLGQANGSFAYTAAGDIDISASSYIVQTGRFDNNDARDDILYSSDSGSTFVFPSRPDGSSSSPIDHYPMAVDWHVQPSSGFGAPDFPYIFVG
jgi:hypothetical protein